MIENSTTDSFSIAVRYNRNRLIFEIWWNFRKDLLTMKNVADVDSIYSFVGKWNMDELPIIIMKRFRFDRFKKAKIAVLYLCCKKMYK